MRRTAPERGTRGEAESSTMHETFTLIDHGPAADSKFDFGRGETAPSYSYSNVPSLVPM